ncbi:blood vessel epicardial substance-like isoform X2 [Anneissia japonica]|uniref:blood vessel epicardial substance-like isoform X2 n=1 Tax=Anneissia japonica TaxID=1529436 RepID=UPI0014256832|nr:blood vessel epicardial substance-like isoform X2 [Anneissia japonica]
MNEDTHMNSPKVPCVDWSESRSSLFHLGCFFLTAGYLTIPNLGLARALWLRVCLVLGVFCFVLWGAAVRCWPDLFAWNLVGFVINILQLAYLIFLTRPIKLDEDILQLHEKFFKPFQISIQKFKRMLDYYGELYELDASGHYAIEGKTKAGNKIAILSSGRMRVTHGDVFLHYIRPGQFVDSPEWLANDGSKRAFQVTITAEEDCRYVQWSRRKLESFLKREPFMKVVLQTSIGRDVSQKLYAISQGEKPISNKSPRADSTLEDHEDQDINEDTGLLRHNWEPAVDIDDDDIRRDSDHSAASAVNIRQSIASGRGVETANDGGAHRTA